MMRIILSAILMVILQILTPPSVLAQSCSGSNSCCKQVPGDAECFLNGSPIGTCSCGRANCGPGDAGTCNCTLWCQNDGTSANCVASGGSCRAFCPSGYINSGGSCGGGGGGRWGGFLLTYLPSRQYT